VPCTKLSKIVDNLAPEIVCDDDDDDDDVNDAHRMGSHWELMMIMSTPNTTGRLLQFVRDMVFKHGWKLEHVLPFVTSNPSRTTALRKGTLEVGGDADVLCLDGKLKPVYVISKGLPVKTPVCTAKGMFELSV
jgi:imidazolonepropionase-like amidohydrolase